MAKRLTDSDKWKKGFIRGLSPKYKLFWLYILDDCTHAGIWETDFEVASIRIGSKITEAEAVTVMASHWAYDFPKFNWADSCITVGVCFLIIDIIFFEGKRNKKLESLRACLK